MGPLVLREDSLIMVKKEEECSFDVLLTYRFFFFSSLNYLFIYLLIYLLDPFFRQGFSIFFFHCLRNSEVWINSSLHNLHVFNRKKYLLAKVSN